MVGLGTFGRWPLHLGSLHMRQMRARSVVVAAHAWCLLSAPDVCWRPVHVPKVLCVRWMRHVSV